MELSQVPSHPYRTAAADIAAKVDRGDLKPGDKLPSIRALAAEYGITTATTQKAIRQLTDDGYLQTVPGLGLFVTDPNQRPADSQPATAEVIIQQLDELQTIVADLAERLHRLENPQAQP